MYFWPRSHKPGSPHENKHDAAIVWAEDVKHDGFKACVRELKNFDGVHSYVQVVSEIQSVRAHTKR